MGNFNIIAASGTSQATAAVIPAEGQIFSVDVLNVPSGSGVRLHEYAYNFAACLVRNSGSNSLLVYPPPNGTIDRVSTPKSVLPEGLLELWAFSRLDWVSMESGGGSSPSLTTSQEYLFLLGGGADLVTGSNVAAFYSILPYDGTFVRFDLAAKVGPIGSAAIFDVLKSSDHGLTWTSLWATTPSNRPTISDGSVFAGGTNFDTISFLGGDWLRIDIVQVGSTTPGQGVTLSVTVVYQDSLSR